MDCREKIKGLVGLCGYVDACFMGDAPEGFNQSPTGFFLTDHEDGLPLLQRIDAARIADRTVWQTLTDARTQAVNDFFHDVNTELRKANESRLQPYAGLIGNDVAGGIISTNADYAGMEIEATQTRGGFLEVRKIGVAIDTLGDTNVKILRVRNRNEVSELYSFPAAVTTTGMQFFELSELVSLSLYDEGCEDLRYWVVIELPTNASPKQSKITCCGARPTWMQFVQARGIDTDLSNIKKRSSYSHGVTIDAILTCKGLDWLCEIDELDGHNLTLNIAKLIQWKSTSKLISSILNTTNINAFTALGREALYGRRNSVQKKYFDGLVWLVDSIPANLTDCWKCKQQKTFKKTEILI